MGGYLRTVPRSKGTHEVGGCLRTDPQSKGVREVGSFLRTDPRRVGGTGPQDSVCYADTSGQTTQQFLNK